ncbi:MAG: hypothetical protein QME51_10095 [Planctomycetota bacterium]|nr:hypothetical protein [Planctomycetota bacterium]
MLKMIRVIIFINLLLFIAGCVTASVIPYPNYKYPSTAPKSVQIYKDEPTNSSRNYERIGEVSLLADVEVSTERIYKNIREKASEIGGHAIIHLKFEQKVQDASGGPLPIYRNLVTGIVIRFIEQNK